MSKLQETTVQDDEQIIELQGTKVPRDVKGLITGSTFFGTLPDYYSFKDVPKWNCVDIHPSKTLIVGSTEQGDIALFNYITKTLVYRISPNTFQMEQEYVNSITNENQDKLCPKLIVPPRSQHDSLGLVSSVHFWDEDTLLWRTSCGRKTACGSWLVALCDNGIFLADYVTRNIKEIRTSIHLQGHKPLCVEPISDQILAIGTSDGILFYNAVSNSIMNILPHRNVCILKSLPPQPVMAIPRPPYRDRLHFISIDESGYGAVWNIQDMPQEGIESQYEPEYYLGPKTVHESGTVISADYDMDNGYLYTLSSDNQVRSWNLYTKKYTPSVKKDRSLESLSTKNSIEPLQTYTVGATHKLMDLMAPLCGALPDAYIPCIDRNSGRIQMIHTKEKDEEGDNKKVVILCDPRAVKDNIPIKTRITRIKRQDTNNCVFACSTTVGLIVFTITPVFIPPALIFPPSYSITESRSHFNVLSFEKQQFFSKTVNVKEKSVEDGHRSYPIASITANNKLDIVEKTQLERCQMILSPDQKKVCLYFAKGKSFKICTISIVNDAVALNIVEAGKCISFAWSSSSSLYAILTVPTAEEHTHLELHTFTADAAISTARTISLNTESAPFALFSGPILTVCVRPTNTEKKIHRMQTNHCVFYSWEVHEPSAEDLTPTTPTPVTPVPVPTPGDALASAITNTPIPSKPKNTQPYLKPLGNRLPSPLFTYWSPDLKYFVLIYKDKTALFTVEPNLHLVYTFPYSVISIYWYYNTIFMTTLNSIYIAFMGKDSSISSFVLSTRSISQINQLNLSELFTPPTATKSINSCPLRPPIHLMPTSPLYILGVEQGHLIMSTPSRQVCLFPLDHPSLRIYMLLGCDNINMVMKWATMLDENQHDNLAVLLQQYGYLDECLKLSGLSPSLRLTLQLNKGDIHSIVNYIKKKDLTVFDDIDTLQLDSKLTPIEPLSGLRKAGILLAKKEKINELKALIELCKEDNRLEDAIFLASFIYKTEPALLTGLLEDSKRFNEASLACQVNAKLKKHLHKDEEEWNSQLDTLGQKYPFLNDIHIETGAAASSKGDDNDDDDEGKKSKKKSKRSAAASSVASSSGKEAKTTGKRERRRRR